MVGQASLTHDELLTAVTEIESIINSRPLSYISADDVDEPLTPSHLLIGRRVLNLPDHLSYLCDPEDEDFDVDSTQLTKRMKHLNNTLNHFWKRWRSEYLAELRESHRNLLKKSHGEPRVSVGDVVIVHEEGLPRSFWKLGRIHDLIVGRDGKTRGATVRVVGKRQHFTSLNRPVQLLYPLEISTSTDLRDTAANSQASGPPAELERDKSEDQPIRQPHPRRAAAQKGEEKCKQWIRELQDDEL